MDMKTKRNEEFSLRTLDGIEESNIHNLVRDSSHSISITTSNPYDDEKVTADKVFLSPATSNSPKITDSPDAENKESPRSAETVAMLINLNVEEQRASKLVGDSKIADISTAKYRFSNSPHQVAETSEDFTDSGDEIKTSNLITNVKHTHSTIKRSKISSHPTTNIQKVASPTERAELIADSIQDTKVADPSVKGRKKHNSPVEYGKTIGTIEVKRKFPSPRRNKFVKMIPKLICSDSGDELDIELSWELEIPSPTTRSNSPRDCKHDETVNISRGDKSSLKGNITSEVLNKSKVETSPKILEPQLSSCEKKIYTHSFQSKQNDQSGYIPLKAASPSAVPSKEIPSPKFFEHQISPIRRNTTGSHHNLATTISPEIGKDYIKTTGTSPSSRPSSPIVSLKKTESQMSPSEKKECIGFHQNVTKTNRSSKNILSPSVSPPGLTLAGSHCSSNANLKALENSDYNMINWFTIKLTKLSSLGDECMNEVFEKMTEFQKELHFLFLYVKKIAHVVGKISNGGKEYVTEDFKNVTSELTARAQKLAENLNLWKSSGDSEFRHGFNTLRKLKILNRTMKHLLILIHHQ
ncbi:hypothetical protein HNY73_007591 [Argiope bruennichi]|uniref:Uncharacterized protein n=1 Tax=Argiope bruennichi TaxID=94029 RepID=A0A8T0FED5_ARGBR|nr:hypothetical protein HNY73_007591 [Argiope bruennichi]